MIGQTTLGVLDRPLLECLIGQTTLGVFVGAVSAP